MLFRSASPQVDLRDDVVLELGAGAGSVAAADLITLNARTTGVVDARAASTIEGSLADVQRVVVADKSAAIDVDQGMVSVVVTDTGSLRADSLNALDAYFGAGTVFVSASTVAGSMADLLTVSADSIPGTGDLKLKRNVVMVLDASADSVTAADVSQLSGRTDGVVDVTGAETIVGDVGQMLVLAADSVVSGNGVARNLDAVVSLVTGASIVADSVLAVDAVYRGVVQVQGASTVFGGIANLLAVSADSLQVDLLDNVVLSLSDDANGVSVRADSLITLDGRSTGLVDALAADWRGAGLNAGDVMAVLRPSDVATVVALLAAWRLGAVVCPLNLRNPPALLAAQLGRVRACALVTG